MPEYIERESLISEIQDYSARRIDNDAIAKMGYEFVKEMGSIQRIIEKAPAADVAEVVRCKDCEKWDTSNRFLNTCACSRWSQSKSAPRLTKPDDFCSYGERKEGAEK